MGGGNVLKGQQVPFTLPPQALICPDSNCGAGYTGCNPICCQEFCLDEYGTFSILLKVIPSAVEDLITTNTNYALRFNILRYADDFSTPAGFVMVSSSPYPIPFIGDYPASHTFLQPGYYFIGVEVWTIDPTTGTWLSKVEDPLAPDPPDACIHILDNELTSTDVFVTTQQATYCVEELVTLDLMAATGYQYIEWVVNGITQIFCFEGGNPLINCNVLTVPFTQAGTYTVTLVTGNSCQEEGEVVFNFSVIECCPAELPPVTDIDTPFELKCCLDDTQFTLHPSSAAGVSLFDGRPAYIVTTSSAWDSFDNDFVNLFGATPGQDVLLDVDLVLAPGVNLTLNETNLRFAPRRRILVQRGSILNLLGSHTNFTQLYGTCNSMWQGVQVEGPPGNDPRIFLPGASFPSNYGILNTRNARIYDAIFAAIATKLPLMDVDVLANQVTSMPTNPVIPSDFAYAPSMITTLLYGHLISPAAFEFSGGMLKIDVGTQFINCLEGANMLWYKTTCEVAPPEICECYVRGTTFTSTGSLAFPFNAGIAPLKTEAGIHLLGYYPYRNNRLVLSENVFFNNNYGIRAAGTQYVDIDNNDFSQCTVATSLLNYSYESQYLIQDLTVTHNRFNNCAISTQASRTQVKIANNQINDTYVPPSGGLLYADNIGFFIHGSNVNVLHNSIQYTKAGVVLLSNDTDPGFVSNNYFNVNAIGVYAVGNNRAMQIVCNDFHNYFVSVYARNYNSSTLLYPDEEGLMSDQGDCDPNFPRPADNFFGQVLSTLGFQIAATPYPAANNFIYWYRNEPGYVPTATVGEVTPMLCFNPNLAPRDFLCGEIGSGMIMEDEEIRNLTDEGIKNYEALKKVYYYVYDQNNDLAAEGLLQDINTYMADRLLVNRYLIQGQYTEADNLLDNLPDSTLEEQNFSQLYQIYSDWRQGGRDMFGMTAQEEASIRQIAATSTQTAAEARTILYLRYGEEYPIDLPPMSDLIDPALFENVYINFKTGNSGQVQRIEVGKPYPNPTKSGLSMDYGLEKDMTATVRFFGHTGNVMTDSLLTGSGTLQIATAEWANGMYYYTVTTSDGKTLNGKVIVLK